jgi:hypothetical protein
VGAATRGDTVVAADMIAASRWMLRLAERAGIEEARAAALETEAREIQKCLASAFGRESVVAGMLEKARAEERRIAARRAEAAIITPTKSPDQWVSSDSGSLETSAGSPGIA